MRPNPTEQVPPLDAIIGSQQQNRAPHLSESPVPADLEALAVEVATEAAEMVAAAARDQAVSVDTKSNANDLVTEVDRAAEELIVGRLMAARPDDGLLGEEGAQRPGTSGVRWVIDPIDGTTNFVYGFPGYAVSIGAEFEGNAIAGAVVDPTAEAIFRARIDGPARRNDTVLELGEPASLEVALVGTGFNADPERRLRQAAVAAALLPQIRDIRRRGAAATDICSVASGQLDAYYEEGLSPWDRCAGALIAARAGALVGDLSGGEGSRRYLVAAPPGLFEQLVAALNALDADGGPGAG